MLAIGFSVWNIQCQGDAGHLNHVLCSRPTFRCYRAVEDLTIQMNKAVYLTDPTQTWPCATSQAPVWNFRVPRPKTV